MAPMHRNPAGAVRCHFDTGAHHTLARHGGTFQPTDESRDDPVDALTAARAAAVLAGAAFEGVALGALVTV